VLGRVVGKVRRMFWPGLSCIAGVFASWPVEKKTLYVFGLDYPVSPASLIRGWRAKVLGVLPGPLDCYEILSWAPRPSPAIVWKEGFAKVQKIEYSTIIL